MSCGCWRACSYPTRPIITSSTRPSSLPSATLVPPPRNSASSDRENIEAAVAVPIDGARVFGRYPVGNDLRLKFSGAFVMENDETARTTLLGNQNIRRPVAIEIRYGERVRMVEPECIAQPVLDPQLLRIGRLLEPGETRLRHSALDRHQIDGASALKIGERDPQHGGVRLLIPQLHGEQPPRQLETFRRANPIIAAQDVRPAVAIDVREQKAALVRRRVEGVNFTHRPAIGEVGRHFIKTHLSAP